MTSTELDESYTTEEHAGKYYNMSITQNDTNIRLFYMETEFSNPHCEILMTTGHAHTDDVIFVSRPKINHLQ